MFTFGNAFIFIAPSERIPRRQALLEAGTVLYPTGADFVSSLSSLSLPVQVVTEAHFEPDGIGLLRVVTTCFGCTSHKRVCEAAPLNVNCIFTPLRLGIYPAPLLGALAKNLPIA